MFLFNKQDPLSQPHFPIYSEPPTTSPTFQIITSKFIITAKVKHYYPKVNSCPLLLFVPYMYHLTKTKSAASFAVAIPPVSFSRNRATILLPRRWRWGPDQEVWTTIYAQIFMIEWTPPYIVAAVRSTFTLSVLSWFCCEYLMECDILLLH